MLSGGAANGAASGAKGDWQAHLTARHVAQLGRLVAELIEGAIEERGKLDFANRTRPRHRGAYRRADKPGLRKRHIQYSLRAEALEKSGGAAKRTAGHVQTQHEGQRVALHLFDQSFKHRLNEGYSR